MSTGSTVKKKVTAKPSDLARLGANGITGGRATSSTAEKVQLTIETIDVATVEQWFEHVDRQRGVRKARVVSIARDIYDGNYVMTGEAFKFDENGMFVDGQHRAQALLLANKMAAEAGRLPITIEAVVVRGVPAEAMTVMDTGAARSPADQLNIANFSNPTLLASAAKWIILFDRDSLYADRMMRTVTHTEIRRFVDNNEHLGRIVETVAVRLRKKIDAMTPATIAASYYLCWRVDPDQADWFFDKLATGAALDESNPILALRSRLRELRNARTSLNAEVYMSLAIRTWNAVRENREMAAIPVYRRGVAIRCPAPK